MLTEQPVDLVEITTDVVASYIAKNSVRPVDLPGLIASVHRAFARMTNPAAPEEASVELKPFVPVKKSITPDYIISLEDGRRLKTMKRYLSGLGMTPDAYRTKWGLPKDYPMVAPGYAARRSALAKSLGLGRKKAEPVAGPEPEHVEPSPSAQRGRPKKSKAA